MDKQRQIEEMIITAYPIYATMEDSLRKEAIECMNSYTVFERLYNAGYRKVPEGAVVLTEEELKEKIDCCDVSMIHHDDDGKRYIEYEKYEDFTDRLGKRIQQLKGQLKQARKETAEKFAERVKMAFYYEFDELIPSIMADKIDEIAKEITEGKRG